MKKIFDFIKNNLIVVKWTAWYFFVLWLILKYIFKFDMFSYHYWWKFFHATLHGFAGLTFGLLVYMAIPVYIATTIITYRKKEYIITIPLADKISAFISKIFAKKTPDVPAPESEPEIEPEPEQKSEYPDDLPPELRIPFMRAKQNMSLTGAVSVYNKQQNQPQKIETNEPIQNAMPIPDNFDIGDSFDSMNNSVPMFKDIDFDAPFGTPIATEKELENNTTKYLTKHDIEFETYHNFVATEKYLIYEHNDPDFWVMDGDSWFASGKQIDSPVNELKDIAKQNELTPVIYLQSTNIMDLDGTIANFESMGIKVVKDLDELN